MLCRSCGNELNGDACFCPQCGAPAEFVTPDKYYMRSNEEDNFQKKKGSYTLLRRTIRETGILPGRSGLSVLASVLLPLTLAAGLLREPFASFILIVGLAKLGRYLLVAGAALHWLA